MECCHILFLFLCILIKDLGIETKFLDAYVHLLAGTIKLIILRSSCTNKWPPSFYERVCIQPVAQHSIRTYEFWKKFIDVIGSYVHG